MPCHLDRLQLTLVGLLGIVREVRQLGHILVQVGVTHTQRIEFGMGFGEKNADVFRVTQLSCFGMNAPDKISRWLLAA